MKKFSLSCFFVCFLLVISSGAAKAGGWYKLFTGKAGGKNATLELIRYDNEISGYIYFDEDKRPQRIIGQTKGDSISISPYTENSSFNDLKGVFKNGSYAGKYFVGESGTSLDFSFKAETAGSDLFDFEFVNESRPLFENFKKSPTVSYMEGCIWPDEKFPQYEYLRSVIAGQKKFPAGMRSVSSILKKNMSNYFNSYFEENKDLTKEELENQDYLISTSSMEEEDIMIPAYFDKNIFVLSEMEYTYTGGAHGNYGTSYITLDLTNKKILKLTDVISQDGTNNLPALLEKNFRKQFDVADTSSLTEAGLFSDTITVNENFCLTPRCMMFCFMPYEIGPWAMGEVNIYIPEVEIDKYLTPAAQNLMKQ